MTLWQLLALQVACPIVSFFVARAVTLWVLSRSDRKAGKR